MNNTNFGLIGMIICVNAIVALALILIIFPAAALIATEQGRIQVASGQYECTLATNEDKTTYWVCQDKRDGK